MRTLIIFLASILLYNCGETKKPTSKKESIVTITDRPQKHNNRRRGNTFRGN